MTARGVPCNTAGHLHATVGAALICNEADYKKGREEEEAKNAAEKVRDEARAAYEDAMAEARKGEGNGQ